MSNTVTLYRCSKCKGIITDPKEGVVVHGNIYVADPTERGGLVGNNFPKAAFKVGKDDEPIVDQIGESVYCKGCFLRVVFPDLKITQTRGLFDEAFPIK